MRPHLLPAAFALILALALILAACGNPLAGDSGGLLPNTGDFPELAAVGKTQVLFTDKTKEEYLGKERYNLFSQYGLNSVYARDYRLDGKQLTIESYQIGGDLGASGIFYYYSGRQLRGQGQEVDLGVQAVLDTGRAGRNLYFYKGRWFYALIYTDKEPVPDLTPLARFLAERTPGNSKRPDGFQYLAVEGVSHQYARVTSGNALNFDIFPPGVYALAPAGGKDAQIFVIDLNDKERAEKAHSDFRRYLQVNAEEFKEIPQNFGKTRVAYYHAIDERQGKLVGAAYDRFEVVVNKLDDFAIGDRLVTQVIENIRADKTAKNK